jgi:hypothetical protein
MREASGRPMGRFSYCALMMAAAFGLCLLSAEAAPAPQSGPATTTVTDTVYQADGSPANGNLIISWPAFVTASGTQVAAGSTNVALAANGTFSVSLVPNAGATPAGVYYTTVYQIGPGEVKTEYWVVPTTSPANLATVRMTPGSGVAGPAVSMQYVNSALATKANDNAVVHLNGAETVSGTKTFATAPSVPAPVNAGDVANKGYVDQSVTNVGAGSYLSIAGGTMTGAITLPANPVSAMQASTKQYVDTGMAAKADLVSGLVPTAELGTGMAGAGTCLQGNGQWGPCGTGTGNLSTTPIASQAIAQPVGTQFSANNLANIRYVTASWNWSQYFSSGTLTANTPATVTLTPCPLGINTAAIATIPYYIALASGNNSVNYQAAESDMVTGGSCAPGAASGTVRFTPQHSYTSGFTVGSATAGIQEAINDGCGVTNSSTPYNNRQCRIVLPPSGAFYNGSYSSRHFNVAADYNIYAPIIFQSNGSKLEGSGAALNCYWRGYCLQIGDLLNTNDSSGNTVEGLSFRTPWNTANGQYGMYGYGFTGCNITQTQRTSQVVTLTTSGCGVTFQPGDMITVMFTDNTLYWGDAIVTATGTNTISYAHPGGDLAAQATPGVVALAFGAIYDNGEGTRFSDISYDGVNEAGHFNTFFDFQDDESAVVEKFNNNGISLQTTATWSGSFFQSLGNLGVASRPPAAAVVTVKDSTVTANGSSCFTFLNSNGLYIDKTVCQAQGLWEVNVSNVNGNYQGADIQNLYSEGAPGLNSVSPAYTPFAGTGSAGEMISKPAATGNYGIRGNGGLGGVMPSGGTGTNALDYFVIVNDATLGTHSNPLYAYHWASTCAASAIGAGCASGAPDNPVIYWPRVANGTDAITYTVLRVSGGVNANGQAIPYAGNCGGGSAAACGSVLVGQPQQAGLVQSFTDSSAGATAAYTFTRSIFAPLIFNYWPGPLVVDASGSGSMPNPIVITDVDIPVSTFVTTGAAEAARSCPNLGFSYGGYIQCEWTVTSDNVWNQTAMMLTDGGSTVGPMAGVKGRLNFTANSEAAVTGHHIITLVDSNPAKTQASNGMRPAADAADTYIGLDNAGGAQFNQAQLAFGSPVSISEYIGNVGNNTSFLERLTASAKTFNVPVTVNGNLQVTSGSVTLPVTGSGFQCLHVSSAGVVSGTGADCGSGGSGSGTVNAGSTSQLAMYSGMGAAVSGDSALTDNGTMLNYTGSGGIAAASASVSGNVTVNGQLQVAGPWEVSSPIPGTPMPPASAGTSALGVSNDGNFYISTNGGTPQEVATSATSSYFPNLWQEDPNTLGAYNGTNPQGFHVYGTYGGVSNYERTGLGWDGTDNYFVLRNENAGSGQQHGIGFWIGSGIRWAIDTQSAFKPFQNNSSDIGVITPSQMVPRTIYAGTSFDTLTQGRLSFELCNNGTTGTALNFLAKYDASGCAVKAAVSDTDGVIGVVSGGWGTSGNGVITYQGYANCSFDGIPALGDYVTASTTNPGDCHDAGTGRPTGVQVLGRVESLNPGSGTYGVRVSLNAPGGTGAPVNSPTFTGTVTLPDGSTDNTSGIALAHALTLPGGSTAITPANSDNSVNVATTAFVKGLSYVAASDKGWIDPTLPTALGGYGVPYTTGGIAPTVDATAAWNAAIAGCPSTGCHFRIPQNSHFFFHPATGAGTQVAVSIQKAGVVIECPSGKGPQYSDDQTSYSGCTFGTDVPGLYIFGSGRWDVVTELDPGPQLINITAMDMTANHNAGGLFYGINTNAAVLDHPAMVNGFRAPAIAAPSAPTCSIASGGSVTAGKTVLAKIAAWSTSGPSLWSAETNCGATSTGNQTVQVTIPTATLPVIGYELALTEGASGTETTVSTFSYTANADGSLTFALAPAAGTFNYTSDTNLGAATYNRTPNLLDLSSSLGIAFQGTNNWNGVFSYSNEDKVNFPNCFRVWGCVVDGPNAAAIEVLSPEFSSCDMNGSGVCTSGGGVVDNAGVIRGMGGLRLLHGHFTGTGSPLGSFTGTAITLTGFTNTITDTMLESNNQGAGTGIAGIGAKRNKISANLNNFANCVSWDANSSSNFVEFNDGTTCTTTIADSGTGDEYHRVGGSTNFGNGNVTTAGTMTATGGFVGNASTASNLSGTPTVPNGTLATTQTAGDNSQKLATTAYVRNEAQLAWTCPVAGATTSGVSYCNWTLPAAVTITQFDLALSTAPAGCTTYPTLQVWDGKANAEVGSFSISTSSTGGNFYPVVTGSTNLAAGEYLRVKVTTGGSGCTTTPAGIVATVTYQMQN